MSSGLILPDTPEIREYCKKRDAQLAAQGVTRDPAAKAKQRLEDNSEYQARKRMTAVQKFVGAVDTLVRARMKYYRTNGNERITYDEIKREPMIQQIIRKYARDNGIE
mgnify:FL=1